MVFGLITASMVLVLSIFAVILEGPVWRRVLMNTARINEMECESTKDEGCFCSRGNPPLQRVSFWPLSIV